MSATSLALSNLRAIVILVVLAFHSVAAYLGSLAAALQVSRVGNLPLTTRELITEIDDRRYSDE